MLVGRNRYRLQRSYRVQKIQSVGTADTARVAIAFPVGCSRYKVGAIDTINWCSRCHLSLPAGKQMGVVDTLNRCCRYSQWGL